MAVPHLVKLDPFGEKVVVIGPAVAVFRVEVAPDRLTTH